jgi:hypothetical protein
MLLSERGYVQTCAIKIEVAGGNGISITPKSVFLPPKRGSMDKN